MGYVSRQIAFYLSALWLAVSFTYFLPDLLGPVPFRAQWGTGDYLTYLWNLAHLNLGTSPYPPYAPVTQQIAGARPWTLILVGGSLVLSAAAGTVLGMLAAWRHGNLGLDRLWRSASRCAYAVL